MPIERIDKLLSSKDLTRKEAKELIKAKKVTVNQKVILDSAFKVNTETDCIKIDNALFTYQKFIYIMQNKPQGVVSASNSPNDQTVIDILPDNLKRPGLFPAGRLDKDTTGFVLITNDGGFAHDILSPRHHVNKTYYVTTKTDLDDNGIQKLEEGLLLRDGTLFLPATVKKIKDFQFMVQICEGKYHQIKRMFSAVGAPVIALERTKIGNLSLDTKLSPGESREITEEELKEITKT